MIHNARVWAGTVERSPTPTREATRLLGLGFIGGAREQMHGRFPLAAEATRSSSNIVLPPAPRLS